MNVLKRKLDKRIKVLYHVFTVISLWLRDKKFPLGFHFQFDAQSVFDVIETQPIFLIHFVHVYAKG